MADENGKTKEQVIMEAATVIVFRNGQSGLPEILMIQRAKELSFAGSAVVFPGGKIHESDRKIAKYTAQPSCIHGAARIAAIRELIEETGLVIGIAERTNAEQANTARTMLSVKEDLAPVLDRFGWTLDLEALVPFAHWVPTFKPGRVFDTRFYLANIGSGNVDLTPDLGESTRLFWTSAREALDLINTGEIKAIYPTRRNLERLAQYASFEEVATHARSTPVQTVSPWIVQTGAQDMLHIPEGLGYPVTAAPLSQIMID